MIEEYITPYLSKTKRGPKPQIEINEIVMLIHHRLKTGCQWRELPIKHFTESVEMGWKAIYHHFKKWCKDGSWKQVWISLLSQQKAFLNLSSMQVDGSHTRAKGGGEAVRYQDRKASKRSNSLFCG